MVQNLCVPTNVFGDYEHTLFLGCSVRSFTCGAGINEQVGSLTVELVQDLCTGTKKYWDGSLYEQTWTAADPGFLGLSYNIIGVPAFFRVQDFEYCGLIHTWDKREGTDGRPVYRVVLNDPRTILEGAKVITGGYTGGVGSAYNLFNAYGYLEQFGSTCPQTYLSAVPPTPSDWVAGDGAPDGAVFGTPTGGFGGAYLNNSGVQWVRVKAALQNLISATSPATSANFSPYGRLLFKGVDYRNHGLLGYDRLEALGPFAGHSGYLNEYYLDLTEVPNPSDYFRISDTSLSLLDFITQAYELCSQDYYIELIPIRGIAVGWAGSTIAKIIKIRTISHATQPSLGAIETFIGDLPTGTLNTNVGRELRNEVTSSLLFGANKEGIYQIEQSTDPEGDGQPAVDEEDDIIVPYFGDEPTVLATQAKTAIMPYKDADGEWQFDAPITNLNAHLKILALVGPTIANHLVITERELQAALGDYDSWMSYISDMNTETYQAIVANGANVVGVRRLQHLVNIIANIVAGNNRAAALDLVAICGPAFQGNKGDEGKLTSDYQRIYDWVHNYAANFYGKKFQVRIPYTCIRSDGTSGQILTSEEPSQSGWTEQASVIKLPNPSALINSFIGDDGKIQAFLRYDTAEDIDLADIEETEYGIYNGDVYVKCDVEPEFVYADGTTYFSPRVVVTVANVLRTIEDDGANPEMVRLLVEIGALIANGAKAADFNALFADLPENLGGKDAEAPLKFEMFLPSAAAVPIKSNVMTYGPWVATGPAGAVRVDNDTTLAPWEYSSYADMNTAGNALATAGLALSQVAEHGTITVPGYPTIPLGAELGCVTGGFYGAGTNLIENRAIASGNFNENDYDGNPVDLYYAYFTYGAWAGTYGPNITSINVNVGPQGVQTQYEMRSFTPKIGKLAKINANRLRQMGRNRIKNARDMKQLFLQRAVAARVQRRAVKNAWKDDKQGVGLEGKSPHSILTGQMLNWEHYTTNAKRTIVLSNKATEVPREIRYKYDEKAFMSFDGLLRPISMDGDGNLPQYTTKQGGGSQVTTTPGAQPPVYDGSIGGDEQYNLSIDVDYLNPVSNPAGYSRSSLNGRCDDYHGHDINILGRGASGDITGTLMMPIEGYNKTDESDYNNDYRFLALRGPLVIHGWGYDTNGFPIPNAADNFTDASGGDFVDEDLECKFMNEWLKLPNSWPVGPVDLRWDRARSVWVAPPTHRLVQGKLEKDICAYASGEVSQINTTGIWNCDGSAITEPKFAAWDKTGNCIPSGTHVVAYYEPLKSEYWIIHATHNETFPFKAVEDVCYDAVNFEARRLVQVGGAVVDDDRYPENITISLYAGDDGFMDTVWGPICSGDMGWARVVCAESGGGDPCLSYRVVNMERKAAFIEFSTTEVFATGEDGSWYAEATVGEFWRGNDPGTVYVRLPFGYFNPECLPVGVDGVAVFDETRNCEVFATGCNVNVYTAVYIDDKLRISKAAGPCDTGVVATTGLRELVIGSGLSLTQTEASPDCKWTLTASGLTVTEVCGSAEAPVENVQILKFDNCFKVTDDSDCTVTVEIDPTCDTVSDSSFVYMSDISISGSGEISWTVTTREAHFNKCGLFIGTTSGEVLSG